MPKRSVTLFGDKMKLHLFKLDGRWYIQHCINRFWRFSYVDKEVAEQVHQNLQRTFKRNTIYNQVKYLVRHFVDRMSYVEHWSEEFDNGRVTTCSYETSFVHTD